MISHAFAGATVAVPRACACRGTSKLVAGTRTSALRLVILKFGRLDAVVEAQIAAASGVQLERYLEHILTAPSIDGVFGRA